MFFGIIVPKLIKYIKHPPEPSEHLPQMDFKLGFMICYLHIMPLICSIIELVVTDMVFLKADSEICFLFGILYMLANWIVYITGKLGDPIFNIHYLDWSHPFKSIFTYTF